MDHPLPCIVCGEPCEPAFTYDPAGTRHPALAVAFQANGQYGSTIFDMENGNQLCINIHDRCLFDRKHMVELWLKPRVRPKGTYVPWDPEWSEED